MIGPLAVPIILLVFSNIIDYITGLNASKYRNEKVNSYKSIRGITKKIHMWLLICVGAIVDELIKYTVAQMGFSFPFSFAIAAIVAVWLICNELISILENIKDIGVPLPDFLLKLTKNIKSQVEKTADAIKDEGGNTDEENND